MPDTNPNIVSVDLTSLNLESDQYNISVKAKGANNLVSPATEVVVDARYGLFDANNKLVATWDALNELYSIRMKYEAADKKYCEVISNSEDIVKTEKIVTHISSNAPQESIQQADGTIVTAYTITGGFSTQIPGTITDANIIPNPNMPSTNPLLAPSCEINGKIVNYTLRGKAAGENVSAILTYTIHPNIPTVDLLNSTIVDSTDHPNHIIKTIYTDTTCIIIPQTVTTIPRYAFYNMKNLTKVVIPKSVTTIGDNAFKGCTNLAEIYYDGTVADWCGITFASAGSNPCFESKAKSVYVKNSTSYTYLTDANILEFAHNSFDIKDYAFYGFSDLASITLPCDLDIGRAAFHLAKHDYNQTSPSVENSNKLEIYYHGTADQWVTNVRMPIRENGKPLRSGTTKLRTSNPQIYGHLNFYDSQRNEYVGIESGINLTGDIEFFSIAPYQFADYPTGTEYINIPAYLYSSDRLIIGEHAFDRFRSNRIHVIGSIKQWCNIRFLDIYSNPLAGGGSISEVNFDTNANSYADATNPSNIYSPTESGILIIPEGVNCLHNAQFANLSVDTVVFPSSLQRIKNYAFAGCTANTYDFRQVKQVPVLSDSDTRYLKNWIKSEKLRDPNCTYTIYTSPKGFKYPSAFSGIIGASGRKIIVPSNLYDQWIANPTWAALNSQYEMYNSTPLIQKDDSNITTVTTLTVETAQNDEITFSKNAVTGLSAVDWGDGYIELPGNTTGENMIHDYSTEYPVAPHNIKLYDVTTLNTGAFQNNNFITKVKFNPQLTHVGAYAFQNCTKLSNITIPSTLTNIGNNAFDGCTAFTSIAIPDTVTILGGYTFQRCSNLTQISIGSGISATSACMLKDCTKLTNIIFRGAISAIAQNTFENCSSLIHITLPDSTSSIQYQAFKNCTGLTNIVLSNSLRTIGDEAFNGCNALTAIYYKGNETEWNALTPQIGSGNDPVTNATKYYYSETKPSTEGNYWHYNANGEIVIWGSETSEGLTYTANADGTAYEVTEIGSCGDANIIIPETYDSKPVTSIGSSAFCNCTGLISITIGNNIKYISEGAFEGCTNLVSATFLDPQNWYVEEGGVLSTTPITNFSDPAAAAEDLKGYYQSIWRKLTYGTKAVNGSSSAYSSTIDTGDGSTTKLAYPATGTFAAPGLVRFASCSNLFGDGLCTFSGNEISWTLYNENPNTKTMGSVNYLYEEP